MHMPCWPLVIVWNAMLVVFRKKIGYWECNLKHYCSSSTKTTEHNIFSRKKSRNLAEVHAETHLRRRGKYGLQSIWCDWSFSNVKTCAAGPQVCSDWGILTKKKKHVQHQGKKRKKKIGREMHMPFRPVAVNYMTEKISMANHCHRTSTSRSSCQRIKVQEVMLQENNISQIKCTVHKSSI